MPELPRARAQRFASDYELSEYDATLAIQSTAAAAYFDDTAQWWMGASRGVWLSRMQRLTWNSLASLRRFACQPTVSRAG